MGLLIYLQYENNTVFPYSYSRFLILYPTVRTACGRTLNFPGHLQFLIFCLKDRGVYKLSILFYDSELRQGVVVPS